MNFDNWHLHPSGKANILGTYTVFHGHGETTANQVCQAGTQEHGMLIAAAPDLLEACQLVIGSMSAKDDVEIEVKRRIEIAVLKATKGTP